MNSHQVIQGLISTEKSVRLNEKNQYAFYVDPKATKIDIKRAIEEFWNAEVKQVRLVKLPKKIRLVGKGRVFTKRQKKVKAYVTFVKEGFDILAFAGEKKEKAPVKVEAKPKTTTAKKITTAKKAASKKEAA
ncbi:MAG: 50S ribosomal protein L23 [Candidatus Gracilibacteria bacterium]|jgi:large subunit ribosomal protein L23|nr:50S ribosomal protein L23 [Candidatus Gracilibacteria bacterium]